MVPPCQQVAFLAVRMAWCWLILSLLNSASAAPLGPWQAGKGFRCAELTVPLRGDSGFDLLPATATGIRFTNVLALDRHLTNQLLLNGSGVAAGDVDGDGWCDLYFCGLDGPNVLYRNLGDWKFQDITEAAGVACPKLDATGAALADFDGDHDLDLIVNSMGGGTHILLNDGQGRFTNGHPTGRVEPGQGRDLARLG